MFIKFFHHLFNPHCPDCALELRDNKICSSCETFRTELMNERNEKKQILEQLLEMNRPRIEVKEDSKVDMKDLKSRNMTWRIQRELLENEDRRAAAILKGSSKTNEELESELGVSNAN